MGDELGRMAYLVLLLVAVGGFLLFELRARPGKTLRLAAAWAMIFLGVIALAGLWGDIRQAVAPQARMLEGGRIEVPMGGDGHFHLTARVNGQPVRFVIDTGATTIALAEDDARRAGIDPDSLAFVGQARTANGMVQTATVMLDSLTIGEIAEYDVPAVVLRSDLDLSLMGMSYLSRFARVSIEGNRLILER
ncbi:retropepsin-like aspartic protease family protein [Paracoccus yeei]|uniref:TIGR02281 family clan AA aspartic protease n=1 Tax=Paracoccus yeei TaxID=147645 RepID=A0A386UL00_9RHOB|nr:TIGR02281 family clan AA aspartic protease [Paracoccus yeei]AYF01201.1 TIGR02281 family clan AA aspartic protease [Paracoccus yeei]MBY0136847.1 TIGR02281 family clan AA aspartic protease [Paracoccus yeei]QEU09005.1 TIGR02281 family clan AA aspartic protease [Paracoccus yeei]